VASAIPAVLVSAVLSFYGLAASSAVAHTHRAGYPPPTPKL
jgi:hypothetical protein